MMSKKANTITVNDIKVGLPVTYWAIRSGRGILSGPVDTEVTSEPWDVGEIVCNVKGKSGGVSIKHLTKR